ncbi:MAG: YkgJ family cysteine cluster protein [Candidatus Sericytochromatia bacterium]
MNINDLTILYFVENYSQEKLIYLKHKNDTDNLFIIYSQIKPKLFDKNTFLTDKRYLNSVLGDIFFEIKTNYFIYLRAEERIPFIPYNNNFELQYYTFTINYHYKDESFLRNEIRLYNKDKILSEGLEIIDLDQTNLNIIIHNYSNYYNDISEYYLKKSISLIERGDYNSESIFYLTDYNLNIFYESFQELILNNYNLKDLKFILDINLINKIKISLDKQSSEYLCIVINELFFYLKNESFLKLDELLIETKKLFPTNINLLLIESLLISKNDRGIDKYIDVIKTLNDVLSLKKNYHKYTSTPKLLLDYKIHYIKALLYNRNGNLDSCIYEYEKCLNITNNTILIKEIKNFLSKNKEKSKDTDFKCETCGNCCRFKSINITHNDIQKILDNKPDLDISDFVSFKTLDKNDKDCDNINYQNNRVSMVFKKKNNGECVFLKDNKCSIHTFKPLICKTWPFTIREVDNQVMWSLHEREFLRDYCKHTLEEGSNDILQLEEDINKFKKDRIKFIETVYTWNYFNKDPNISFLDFALKFSDKNILDLENKIKYQINEFFKANENIDLLEYKPFISTYFIKTLNNFSFGIHTDNYKNYISEDFLESMKKYLNAYTYVITNIPNTYITFYIENNDLRYSVDLYLFNTINNISLSNNSEVLFIKENIEIFKLSDEYMIDYTITNLLNILNYINDSFINNKIENFNIIETVNNIIFSLVSILNKQNFELLKHNDYKVMNNNFNKFLLSDYSFSKNNNKQDIVKYLKNANETFIKIYNLYKNTLKET